MNDIVKKILEKIRQNEGDSLLLDSPDSRQFDLKKENFYALESYDSDKKIAFVDGGNLEVFSSPSISLFFNRAYFSIYQNNKRIGNGLSEFFTLINAVNMEDKIFFKTEYFYLGKKLALKEYLFDSFDKNLTSGNSRAKISVIGDVIRRFSELAIAGEIDADFIILDGTLESKYPFERDLLDSIKNPVYGLAKTTSLITANGNSAAALVSSFANEGKWGYFLGKADAKDHDAFVHFLKLNGKAKHVFRFEAKDEKNIMEAISLLTKNSRDPVFLGYPYGLVEADRFARVTNREKESLMLQLSVLIGKDIEKVFPYINSGNAHDILDSVG